MIRFFAGHKTAANILLLALLAIGLSAIPTLKLETFPEVKKYEVQVTVAYPGAAPSDVEEGICIPLERATDGISFLDEKRCEAKDNFGVMTLKMLEVGTMVQFIEDVKSAIDGIDNFPTEIEEPVVKELGRIDPVVDIAISGDLPRPALKELAEDLRRRAQREPGIPLAEVRGFSDRQLRVEIPMQMLEQYGLSILDIADRIKRQGVDLPAGIIEADTQEIQLRFTDLRRTVDDLGRLVIVSSAGGGEVLLRDIATITDTFEKEEDKITFNGKPAAVLAISKNKSDDSLKVLAAVEAFVAQEHKRLPEAITLALTSDRASIVQERLDLLSSNGMMGIMLVALALFLFFSLRYTFWVAMGLPVSFLASFALISALGMSINMISMVALLVAIGILMDDAIVIAENIASERHKGKAPLDAVVDGTKKVTRGVLSSFATTVLIFSSLLMMKGDLGQIMRVLPIVLISVLTVSLIEAFLILPRHLLHALEHGDDEKKFYFQKKFDAFFERVRQKMYRLAVQVVVRRYAFVGGIIALFIVSVSMLVGGVLKFQAFPDLDGDIVEARVLMVPGTSLDHLEGIVQQTLDALEQSNKLLSEKEDGELVKNVRVTYSQHVDAFETGPHLATIVVDLLSAETRSGTIADLTNDWRARVGKLPGVLSVQYRQPQVGPAGRAIHIRLQGDDMDELALASNDLKAWLHGYDGVVDILDDLRSGRPILQMRLKEGAYALGIDAQTIAGQVRAGYQGIIAKEIQSGDETFEIRVSLDKQSRSNLDAFDRFSVLHPKTGAAIPLDSIALVEEDRSYSRIHRVNNIRTVSVFADVDSERINAGDVLKDVGKKLLPEFKVKYPGVSIALEGEAKNSAVTMGSLQRGFMLGLFGVFLLLSFQFRSYLEPIVVMVAIPLAFIGVIWGHLIMGINLTMPSMVGAVSLAGIVVNDSILLVEFTKARVREGMALHDAAAAASRDRFRAIFLTSFTTVAGMLPLLLETSMQAQVLIPIVVSISFGISMSTVLVLFFLPALYSIFEDFGFTANDEDDLESVATAKDN